MRNGRTKKAGKQALAILLSAVMIAAVFVPSVTAYAINVDTTKLAEDTYVTSQTNYTIAPGITESQITLNNGSGSNQVKVCAAEVDLNNPYNSVIASYKNYDGTSWGMQKVRDQAAAAEKKLGTNVVAGVNADLFNMQTGAPFGSLVMNGVRYNTNNSQPYVAVLKDGRVVIKEPADPDYLSCAENAKELVGGFYILVKNGEVSSDPQVTENPDYMPRTAVGVTKDNKVIIYTADGRQAPYSCGQTPLQVARVMAALGCEFALNFDGGGSTTFLSQHEGSEELECRNSPSDGMERTVSTAFLVCTSAKPTGVFDHASLTPNNEVYTPDSTVTFEARGVDSSGAGVALPADGKFILADNSYGSITPEGVFTSTGKEGVVTVNYMSGGKKSGEVSIEIRTPDSFYVPNNEVSLGFEETTDFSIEARYNSRTVNMKDGDIEWSITNEAGEDISGQAGTFNGLTFTTFDGVTVNAKITATLKYNRSITAEIKAIIGAMPVVLYDFENYTTDKQAAESNPDLHYIPSYTMPNWDYNRGADPEATKQKQEFYEQGYPLYSWPNSSLTDQNSMKTSIVFKDDGAPVRFGESSLRIDYDFSTYTGSGNPNNYVRVTDPDYKFEGSPTAIGAWVYVPEGTANFALYLNCATFADEENVDMSYGCITGSTGINWTGWKYVEFNLNDSSNYHSGPAYAPYGMYQGCGLFWISYQPGGPLGDKTASTIYLDNIQLVYGANTDDVDNPNIRSIFAYNYAEGLSNTGIVDGKTVFNTNTLTLQANVNEVEGKYMTGLDPESAKMYIDGVDVTGNENFFFEEHDGELYLYDAVLPNGVHSIEVSISDLFGNTTTETRYFTVKGESKSTEASFEAVEEAPVLGEKYNLAIKSNDPADILSADVGVKILSNFTTYWDDFTVEPSENYELEGEATYDDKETTINFKLNRKADADPAKDDGTLGKIVINVPADVPEGLQVTYRVSKGALTYKEAKDSKFTGSFSGKITTECKSPFVLKVETMLVGASGGNIYVYDQDGNPVEGANVYTSAQEPVGVTDAEGKVFTDKFTGSLMQFSIYAEKDGKLSFTFNGQSFTSGATEDGLPAFIRQNATVNPAETKSISWMSSPLNSKAAAVVKYAEKSAYDSGGESALTALNGESYLSEMSSSAQYTTNYAVRINNVNITGLKPNTEYAYQVGDGEKMSEIRTFKTEQYTEALNFFVIGDTQATDTTNSDKIVKLLSESGKEFAFGIQTGDAVDNGGNYMMWENIAKVFSGDFLGSKDLIQVLGNHEYYGDATATNASEYFDLPGTKDGEAPLCYSTSYANVYIAVINYGGLSNYRKATEWLVKDAAQSNATWKILAMHQPAYFTNPAGNSLEMQEIISTAVDKAGIDFVFSGHDHSYARTMPLTGGEVDNQNGAVYYICGSTGEKSYDIVDNKDFHFDALNGDYNAVYITASVTDTEFEVVTYDLLGDGTSAIIDTYTMTKEVTCTENGHDFRLNGDYLTCAKCGYSIPKSGYTGFLKDPDTGKMKYLIAGEIKTGWFALEKDYYYFDADGNMVTGSVKVDGKTYTFGSDGKLTKGALVKEGNAYYYYIAGEKQRGWHMIDGYWYYFDRVTGFKMATGKYTVSNSDGTLKLTYTFDKNGRLTGGAWSATQAGTSYYWGPDPVRGLKEIGGETYYFYPDTTYMCVNASVAIDGKVYSFDEDGVFRHYGEHADNNGDGKCDLCFQEEEKQHGVFWRLFDLLRRFFLRIRDFFVKILDLFRK